MGERSRIEAAGGRVLLVDCWRVDGNLNLSRALGVFEYKDRKDLPPEKQKITAAPELKEVILKPHDDFVVMGSDGVFDVFTSERLVQLLSRERRAGKALEACVDTALQQSLPSGD